MEILRQYLIVFSLNHSGQSASMMAMNEELISSQSCRDKCAGANERETNLPSNDMGSEVSNSNLTCFSGSVPEGLSNNDPLVVLSKQHAVDSLRFQEITISGVERANEDFSVANQLPGVVIENAHCPVSVPTKKTVQFASTKKVRQYDIDACTNFPEEELDIDFRCISNLRSRKASKKKPTIKTERSSTLSISNLLGLSAAAEHEPRSVFTDEPERLIPNNVTKKEPIKVALIHSHAHTQILHKAMQYIHSDRDTLLESLLKWCGFFHGASKGGPLSSFFTVVPPKCGTRKLLEEYHGCHYLDLLQFHTKPHDDSEISKTAQLIEDEVDTDTKDFQAKLTRYGLEDDCPFPLDRQSHELLWKYCLAVIGASCHAASLLSSKSADVALHWGGGRHHAHDNKAGGFCYVNDIVLAIRQLLHPPNSSCIRIRRVLYLDVDIHHPDGVQSAFYSTDEVLTASFHRHAAGFFPASSGSISEKGQSGTKGLGFNLNVPLPAGTNDVTFLYMYQKLLFGLVDVYDPHAIVLCVGADGLKGDPLVSGGASGFDYTSFSYNDGDEDVPYYIRREGTDEGWSLSPECLAECVRIAAALCSGHDEERIYSLPTVKNKENNSMKSDTGESSVDNSEIQSCPVHSPQIDQERLPDSCTSNTVRSNETGSNNDSSIKLENGTNTTGLYKPSHKTPPKGRRRKLLVLGGGGYSPSQASRTWLLSTAAACEGARPNLFWKHLPKDVPNHEHLLRYGPSFELVSSEKLDEFSGFYSSSCQDKLNTINADLSPDGQDMLQRGIKAIDLACLYIRRQSKKHAQSANFSYQTGLQQDEEIFAEHVPRKSNRHEAIRRGRRKKTKRLANNVS